MLCYHHPNMGKQGIRTLVLFLLAAWQVFAQGTTSRLIGTVTDPAGSAVSGASVTLSSETTGASFTTTTSQNGTYVFEDVQSGL